MKWYRRVIQISCEDSPNIRLARMEIAAGCEPSGKTIVPGVIGWHTLQHHRAVWDIVRQTIGLDGKFYKGAQLLLFPPQWLNASAQRHREIRHLVRKAKAIGIDPAEGGDKTAIAVVDELGIIELITKQTTDTSVIRPEVIGLMDRYGVPPDKVCFDRGGGGKQIADEIRANGRRVRTVGFGDSLKLDPKRGMVQLESKLEIAEEKYAYLNRRAQMFYELSAMIAPLGGNITDKGEYIGFALPGIEYGPEYILLRKELSPIDRLYDKEGRQRIRSKNRPPGASEESKREKTLVELIGHSPDEADAVVLAVHAMLHRAPVSKAGVA